MKKYIGYVIIFVMGLITAGSLGVAAYNYNANNIEYSPSDKTWNVSTVAEAINSLVNDTRGSVMNYSLDEQVVGTWIDGKPIYQKSFLVSNINGNVAIPFDCSNLDWVVDMSFIVQDTDSRYKGYHTAGGGTYMEGNRIDVRPLSNEIWISFSDTGYWQGGKASVTVQYTKTTDTGNSNNS